MHSHDPSGDQSWRLRPHNYHLELGGSDGTGAQGFCASDFCPGSGFRRMGHMKNTGKRIFFAALVIGLSNLAVVGLAGALWSQR
jgi:hypothetical protein